MASSIPASAHALACSASHISGYRRPKDDRLAASPDDGSIDWPVIILHPEHIPWIKPPPIVAPSQTCRWKHFVQTTLQHKDSPLNDHVVMKDRGYNFRDREYEGPFYDRINMRQLWFEDLYGRVPGLVGDAKFGRPVPYYPFVQMAVGGGPLPPPPGRIGCTQQYCLPAGTLASNSLNHL